MQYSGSLFAIFGQFWRILGGLGRLVGSIFGVFGASKKGAKFERISGSIFEDSGRVRRSRVGCSEAFRPLKIAWYGMVRKDG